MNPATELPRSVALNRLAVLAFYYSLIAFFIISTPLMLGEVSLGSTVISLIQVFPLLLFARGLQTTRARTYGWMSFVVLPLLHPWRSRCIQSRATRSGRDRGKPLRGFIRHLGVIYSKLSGTFQNTAVGIL